MLKKLFPIDDLKRTVLRFPGSAICSAALFILAILSIHDVIDLEDEVFGRLVASVSCGFFWFGFARLVREGLRLSAAREWLIGGGGFVVLVALIFMMSGMHLVWLLGLMSPALLLGISVAPYLKDDDNLSYWFYNRQVWLGAALAFLAALLWFCGLAAALASIQYLFKVDIESELYADLWVFAAILFGPLYALSWVPEKFKFTQADCHAPPQLAFMVNWVLAPLVVVYMLILYAYFIKIGLAGEVPRGQLAYLVTAFGGAGVITYLCGWALREQGGPLLKLVYKLFFPALFIPVAVQAFSIYLRIEQYGVTESRYLVALSTVWFAFLAVVYTFKKLPLKWSTGSLAILMLVAAFGPLSAPNVAQWSQLGRLERVLKANDMLVDGTLRKAADNLSFEDRKTISSIVDFLHDRRNLDSIEGWVPGDMMVDLARPDKPDDPKPLGGLLDDRKLQPYHVTEALGFKFVSAYRRKSDRQDETIRLTSPTLRPLVDVGGYKYFLYNQNVWLGRKRAADETYIWEYRQDGKGPFVAYYEDERLVIGVEGHGLIRFDIEDFARKAAAANPGHERRELILEKTQGDLRVKVIFANIHLIREEEDAGGDKAMQLKSFNFRALVDY